MKIDGVNHSNYHPYKHAADGNVPKQGAQRKDHLEISTQAKQLQQKPPVAIEREQKVERIKNEIESGQYRVDAQETAKKFYEFWMKK
ncbi:MAG TPA: flagellar biosynthesis anti-sigma factor FlgM [Bacillales bacterium]|nr:flagellar biosynthesis anti-sigma factor FlgM [Bacillales bacterium]